MMNREEQWREKDWEGERREKRLERKKVGRGERESTGIQRAPSTPDQRCSFKVGVLGSTWLAVRVQGPSKWAPRGQLVPQGWLPRESYLGLSAASSHWSEGQGHRLAALPGRKEKLLPVGVTTLKMNTSALGGKAEQRAQVPTQKFSKGLLIVFRHLQTEQLSRYQVKPETLAWLTELSSVDKQSLSATLDRKT